MVVNFDSFERVVESIRYVVDISTEDLCKVVKIFSVEIMVDNFCSFKRIVESIKNVVGISGIVDKWVVIGDNEVEKIISILTMFP